MENNHRRIDFYIISDVFLSFIYLGWFTLTPIAMIVLKSQHNVILLFLFNILLTLSQSTLNLIFLKKGKLCPFSIVEIFSCALFLFLAVVTFD